jgi:hypothetical protein
VRLPSVAVSIRSKSSTISGSKIVLLVVPPQTDPDDAHAIMMAASANDDATSVDKLLASATPHAERN